MQTNNTNDDDAFAAIKNKKSEATIENKRHRVKPSRYRLMSDEEHSVVKLKTDKTKRRAHTSSSSESEDNDFLPPPTDYSPQRDHISSEIIQKNIPVHQDKTGSQPYEPFTETPLSPDTSTNNDSNDDSIDRTYDESQFIKKISISERDITEIGCHDHSCCQRILSELKSLKAMVSAIYLTMSDENDKPKSVQKIDFEFPIETSKQLTAFETKIKNAVAAAQYQKTVKQIGGLSVEKHIRNALVLTLSDIIAYRMSWTGAKNTIMVKNMHFVKLIADAIAERWKPVDNAKIESVIKSWLQHAGDRIKGRGKN